VKKMGGYIKIRGRGGLECRMKGEGGSGGGGGVVHGLWCVFHFLEMTSDSIEQIPEQGLNLNRS
jgi:hypothetical protein